MIAYASRTGTRRTLAKLADVNWRLMVSARGVLRHEGFRYALDNGAWTAFQEHRSGKRATAHPDLAAFEKAISQLGSGADFVVVPDIVQGGARSWAMTRAWLRRLLRDPRLRGVPLLLAVQDGFDPWTISRFLNARVGIFVGGSTEWKLATVHAWGLLAQSKGAYCHVGRVNTARRIHLCAAASVNSFDGSGWAIFSKLIHAGELARQQMDIEAYIERQRA